jgi:hypothetical protein
MSVAAPSAEKPPVERVSNAQADLLAAETALETAIRAIEVLPRSSKTSVNTTVATAFQKVRDDRAELRELESLIAGNPSTLAPR